MTHSSSQPHNCGPLNSRLIDAARSLRTNDPKLRADAAWQLRAVLRAYVARVVALLAGDEATVGVLHSCEECARAVDSCLTLRVTQPTLLNDGIVVETLSESPDISIVRNVLSGDEALDIIRYALPRMRHSVVYNKGHNTVVESDRSSLSASLGLWDSALINSVASRIASLCQCPIEQLEQIQVIRYDPGQFFASHYDFIDEVSQNTMSGRNDDFNAWGGQRIKTVLIYLNHLQPDESGAYTYFPRAHVRITCEPGSGIMWNNVDVNMDKDTTSEHGGESPSTSTKFVLVSWMRERVPDAHSEARTQLVSASNSAIGFENSR